MKKPVFSKEKTGFLELAAGLEPATCALRIIKIMLIIMYYHQIVCNIVMILLDNGT